MNDKYCNTRDQPVYGRFLQIFSCRVNLANDGFIRKVLAPPKTMRLDSDGLSFEGLTVPWSEIQQVERKGARISITKVDSKINIIILSPITGMQDPNLAMLLGPLMIALTGGQDETARTLFKKLQAFFMARKVLVPGVPGVGVKRRTRNVFPAIPFCGVWGYCSIRCDIDQLLAVRLRTAPGTMSL